MYVYNHMHIHIYIYIYWGNIDLQLRREASSGSQGNSSDVLHEFDCRRTRSEATCVFPLRQVSMALSGWLPQPAAIECSTGCVKMMVVVMALIVILILTVITSNDDNNNNNDKSNPSK